MSDPSRRRPLTRRGTLYLGLALLVVLAVAHWIYWYRPRERHEAPESTTGPGAAYLDSDLAYRLWLPYPHQNLVALEEALGDMEGLVSALARVSGQEVPQMPSFGAADVPPSRELALASDPDGERFIAVARVYPIAAMLARWAGRLAGNPLLTGGEAEIDGRPVEARWEGNTWIVASRGLEPPPAGEGRAPRQVALAWIGLSEAPDPIAATELRLFRERGDLTLVGGEPVAVERLADLGRGDLPLPLVAAQSFPSGRRLQARLLALLPGVESIGGLPGAITASRGKRRWRPPGERILSAVGDGPPTARIEGFRVVALDRASLESGGDLVEVAERLAGHPPLNLAVWIELRAASRLVDQVVEALEAVPIIGEREARPWRAGAGVLHRFSGYRRLTAFASADPPALLVRLERSGPSAETTSGDGVAAGAEN